MSFHEIKINSIFFYISGTRLTENQDQDITHQLNQMKHIDVDGRHWRIEIHSKFVLADQYMYQVRCVYESITALTGYCAG